MGNQQISSTTVNGADDGGGSIVDGGMQNWELLLDKYDVEKNIEEYFTGMFMCLEERYQQCISKNEKWLSKITSQSFLRSIDFIKQNHHMFMESVIKEGKYKVPGNDSYTIIVKDSCMSWMKVYVHMMNFIEQIKQLCHIVKKHYSRYLIVTNGATGSGKSSLIKKTISHYNLSNKYSQFLIDDLIENNEHYKKAIDKLILEECKSDILCDKLRGRLENPDGQMYQKFGTLYMKYRGKSTPQEEWCDDKKKTCDQLLDDMLGDAIQRGKNIVFETVGTYYVDWLISKLHDKNPDSYEVFYAFTIVDFCENIRRNKTRAVDSMASYIKNKQGNPAPRLPDVSEDPFRKNIQLIQENLEKIVLGKASGGCSKVDHIVVFNNNVSRDKAFSSEAVLYDSDTCTSINDAKQALAKITEVQNIRKCA